MHCVRISLLSWVASGQIYARGHEGDADPQPCFHMLKAPPLGLRAIFPLLSRNKSDDRQERELLPLQCCHLPEGPALEGPAGWALLLPQTLEGDM